MKKYEKLEIELFFWEDGGDVLTFSGELPENPKNSNDNDFNDRGDW